ncbi:hypothetical protein MMC30_007585 [Trapelia coarctata]|nr:hypothetical protein [Trapelia coarctata]
MIFACQTSRTAAIHSAETHPDVELYAIASRDASSAQKAAKSYNFNKSYGAYQGLLDDPEVDIVYVSTPNGLRYEWASKALVAGKLVLLEKLFTTNGFEAKKLIQQAEKGGKVLTDASRWGVFESKDLEPLVNHSCTSRRLVLGYLTGGNFMDCTTYALSFTRLALHAGTPEKILSVAARRYSKDKRVDAAMKATMLFRDSRGDIVQSRACTDMARAWMSGVVPRAWELPAVEVETDKAVIYFYKSMMPHLYHFISITDIATSKTTYKKQYSGELVWGGVETLGGKGGKPKWSTYRWQLEAFVSKV